MVYFKLLTRLFETLVDKKFFTIVAITLYNNTTTNDKNISYIRQTTCCQNFIKYTPPMKFMVLWSPIDHYCTTSFNKV